MKFPRASGVLLHPTSLPSDFGIGDLGPSAHRFVDLLADARQTYWQILPLGPTGYGDSPYQCFSAFAGNTNLISPELLLDDGLVGEDDLEEFQELPDNEVDFGAVIESKERLLRTAYRNFAGSDDISLKGNFELFVRESVSWLDDYAVYRAIKKDQGGKEWLKWDVPLRTRKQDAMDAVRLELSDEILTQKFFQFVFFRQWYRLRTHASGKRVKIVGDIPIFVALDSADVWTSPELFKLREDLSPEVVSGVPPDYFSKTGQLWGNPIYDWDRMRADGFKWWAERFRSALKLVDIVRIDHFRGFAASWEVPGDDETAENGKWVEVPGRELFRRLEMEFGDLPVMAEDLGVITGNVEALRDEFGFPGMRILQYAFGGGAENPHLPFNYPKNSVVYPGTHDNETAAGWFRGLKQSGSSKKKKEGAEVRKRCLRYLNSDGKHIHLDLLRACLASVADTAIIPLQDLLGLGNDARMNTPATESGNWKWRFREEDLTDEILEWLEEITELYGRAP
ncbi:MAG: 4-alpha-glucanotransferase [Aridibacter famidurans]|nr:4-alpha-glucanotransferase [Aridibacter famidurans]